METLSVVHTVANRLRELNPDMDIHISSTDAKVYIPTGQQVTILIHYCGSVFAEPENTDATVQKQLIRISATVIVPQISDAINALDRLRRSLGGIELPDCDRPLWLESEKYIGDAANFCRYALDMTASTLFIAEQESKDLPLLTVVNYEEIQ
ncbi:Gp37 family protein [Salmonella enterica]|uniref:Gp37 family protein n=1 Tax=Salmonella enterica TaxID=28901 RepID=UPI0018D0D3C4|nr:Gp37 family protein [Salmonella enterica]MBH0368770.1 Gp37 family protein [Salmonella enterica]MBH0487517.1 Gp37 family protein [Salmonella enterica]MBH5273706.1 Gp37 family protein [Salmonella enterica]MBH5285378.1 Gp37 family protein [Salmonella enterica]MDO3888371.1 Gp37 family protein [Salmonella enterica]